MKLTTVEGNRQHLDGGAMFGNAPKELWKRWTAPDESNRIPLATRTLLYQKSDGTRILFEAGIGAFFEPKLKQRYGIYEQEHVLLANLNAIGVPHDTIDAVVLSHLHFDHVGGLLPAYGEDQDKLLFPNAHFYVGREHWERAQHPKIRERASFIPHVHKLLKDSKRLCLMDGHAHSDLGKEITFEVSHGHTIGLMVPIIEEKITFISDVAPGFPWVHLPITMGYDRFPELLVEEKMRLFERMISNDGVLFFTHDPDHAYGKLSKSLDGRISVEEVRGYN